MVVHHLRRLSQVLLGASAQMSWYDQYMKYRLIHLNRVVAVLVVILIYAFGTSDFLRTLVLNHSCNKDITSILGDIDDSSVDSLCTK